ncbi:hypothetical protein [Janthinobacterium sp. CG_S6]|uniref:hypothetical protein n=1 Tax=Janthinobacterium sp. CG_S6 TaxID=3071707 RepID=UPI002E0B8907|nr:hypothetical protein [Janthinobacterium sp. CG_S6]
MSIQIVSIEQIKEKAREAFERGQSRDSHAMNWHSAALPTWLEEYDRLSALAGEEVVA